MILKDTIGNRTKTWSGGDTSGANLRPAIYSINNLNQITQRDVPGTNDVIGAALVGTNVTVNGLAADRKAEYFHGVVGTNNASQPFWLTSTIIGANNTLAGHLYVAKEPEQFQYDPDGNLTSDGRWTYTWDGENRLIGMTVNTSAGPQNQLTFAYDWQGRRIQKVAVTNGVTIATYRFLYDGWNLEAEMGASGTLVRSYVWGADLSGSSQGEGGVGGLLETRYYGASTTNAFAVFDGNGNVSALVNAADGTVVANYEYGPFGEVIRNSGPMAKNNPLRFSTKYQDYESDLLYYDYRFYNPSQGKWISRDLLGESGGASIYLSDGNDSINSLDPFGLEWVVTRNGDSRAVAYPTRTQDTWSDLAAKVGLDASDYQKWVAPLQGPNDLPSVCKTYTVPNTVTIDLGRMDFKDRYLSPVFWEFRIAADLNSVAFSRMGFHVIRGRDVTRFDITSHLVSKDLFIYMFYGHGDKDRSGAINTGGDGTEFVDPRRYTHQGLNFMDLTACDGLVTPPGQASVSPHY